MLFHVRRTDIEHLEPVIEQLFGIVQELYTSWTARCFLIIDVPPIERCPAGAWHIITVVGQPSFSTCNNSTSGLMVDIDAEKYTRWNEILFLYAKEFASSTDASVCVVSAHRIISEILDNPEEFGLFDSGRQSQKMPSTDDLGEDMWEDHLHLSGAAHIVFGGKLLRVFDEGTEGGKIN